MMDALVQVYRHRLLAEILVGRELKARYRGTALGFLWSFVNPLLLMGIYSLVFSVYLRVNIPHYGPFVLAGLLPWTCFTTALMEAMGSIISNGNLIKKVYMPSEIFPFVSVTSNMMHYLLSIPVLLMILHLLGISITGYFLFFPLLFILQWLFSYACGLILSTLAVQFRDLIHGVPNLLMVWFYLTPVVYSTDFIPPPYRAWVRFNPMTGLIEAYRNIFLEARPPSWRWTLAFATVSVGLLMVGSWLFHRRSELHPELI